jgi:paraquat-inducible protein B
MSSKANLMAVGAFVVGAVALAVVGILIFGSGKLFTHTTKAVCFFTSDVTGLNVGAPVKFKGVDVGSVADIRLRLPEETSAVTVESLKAGVRIPVVIEIDSEKVAGLGVAKTFDPARLKELIESGLRAQLVSQSLVTGLLLVKLDFNPEVPATFALPPDSRLVEIPTAPTSMEQLGNAAHRIAIRLEALDFEKLVGAATGALEGVEQLVKSPALRQTVDALPAAVASVNEAFANVRELTGSLNREQGPLLQSLKGTSDTAGVTLGSVQSWLAPNAPLAVDLAATLREVTAAAHSVRLVADSLDRNPSAIVRGTVVQAK